MKSDHIQRSRFDWLRRAGEAGVQAGLARARARLSQASRTFLPCTWPQWGPWEVGHPIPPWRRWCQSKVSPETLSPVPPSPSPNPQPTGLPAALQAPVLVRAPGPLHSLSALPGVLSHQPRRGQFRGITQVSAQTAAPPRAPNFEAPAPFPPSSCCLSLT